MKKLLSLIVAAAMVLSVCCMASAEGVSGTFEGTSQGFHGPVTVAVTLEDGVITDCVVTEENESEGVSDWSIAGTPARIVEAQSWNIDTLTGATYSSNAVKYAAKAAIEASGATGLDAEYHVPQGEDETLDVDVVVVGAGLAGLSAAVEAHDAGASVLVLEKLDRIGGSSITAGGIVYGTHTYMNADVDEYDPEDMVQYYTMRGNNNIDVDLVRYWAEHSGESVDWLHEVAGVEFATLSTSGISPAMRGHTTANGGAGIILPLYNNLFTQRGIELRTGTTVTDILTAEDGKTVTGVTATCNGATITVNAKAVIVACGGYDASEEAKEHIDSPAVGIPSMSSCGNTGDYIAWGEKLGASMIFKGGVMGMHTSNPSYTLTGGVNLLSFLPTLGVDQTGRRFMNESTDYPIFYTKIGETGYDTVYWIFDASYSGGAFTALFDAAVPLYGYKADTIEELAEAAGMDPAILAANVRTYNDYAAAGVDMQYGATSMVPLASEGPYYAIKVVRATVAGFGGFEINTSAEVQSTEGTSIPGLYAAGECASGQFFDQEYPCSGSMLCISTTFGRVAGQQAAAFAAAN